MTALWQPANVAALVYTGVVTSALAVVAESVALAHVSAEETTVILRWVGKEEGRQGLRDYGRHS